MPPQGYLTPKSPLLSSTSQVRLVGLSLGGSALDPTYPWLR